MQNTFLATGEAFTSLAAQFCVGETTVARIVDEVCSAIWEELKDEHLKMPNSEREWRLIAENFKGKREFPNCLGALDGKHIVIASPANSGSLYFNYKGTFSVVLMALVDSYYKFKFVDVGAYGRNSDGGIFKSSKLGVAMTANTLKIPPPTVIPGAENLGPMPYVMVGDEAFPLSKNLMRPFPGKGGSHEVQIFNYRLSRARIIVEHTFGILATRWRVFHTKIAVRPELVAKIVKATCVLHNMLQAETTPAEVTQLLQQCNTDSTPIAYQPLQLPGNRGSREAIDVRNKFMDYFVNYSPLTWQDTYVRRGTNREIEIES